MIRFTKFPPGAFTKTIPVGADLLYDLGVRYDSSRGTFFGAFVQFRQTALYAIIADGTVRMIPQREAAQFVADTDNTLIV